MKILYSIPHFNNARKLLRCIESINKFKEKDSLIIIIDDFSLEEELNIILNSKWFNDFYLNNIIFFERNIINRNRCIDFAINKNIEYITFIDADDYLINKIEINNLLNEDIVFYDSAEVMELKTTSDFNNLKILKQNKFKFETLQEEIKNYAIRPNQINSLTTCWSKIYKTNVIKYYNIRFNEKMRTYEDVDFLIKYLDNVNNYKIFPTVTYIHTNNSNYISATFGYNESFNSLFGYLQVCRRLSFYFNKRNIHFNKFHFMSCYLSITLIRIAFKMKKFREFQNFYKFIKKRLKSTLLQKSFSQYDVELANGRSIIKVLVKNRFALLLTIYVTMIGRHRYNKMGIK